MATTTRLEEAASAASETAREVADYVARTTERVRDEIGTTERRLREVVEAYPLTTFFGAVLAGWLIGRIASRL
jgi:hypothetical protein